MKHDNVPTSVHTFGGKNCITAPLTVPTCLCLCDVSFDFFATNNRREGGMLCGILTHKHNVKSWNCMNTVTPNTDLVLHSSLETLPNHICYSAWHYQENQTSDSDVQECFLSVLLHLNNKNVTLLKLSCVMQSSHLTECGWNKNWALIGRLRLVMFAKAPICLHLF